MRANCGDLGISPDHIAVTGNSAGGHLSLMVAGVDGTLYPELEGGSGSSGVSSAVQACGAVYPVTIVSRHKSVLNPIGRNGSRHVHNTIMPDGSTARDLVMFSPCAFLALFARPLSQREGLTQSRGLYFFDWQKSRTSAL